MTKRCPLIQALKMYARIISCLLPTLGLVQASLGQCEIGWTDGFADPVATGRVHCMAKFDEDGPGPRPASWFVGGDFSVSYWLYASSSWCQSLGRYEGGTLGRVGSSVHPNFTGPVFALQVFDDDGTGPIPEALYACGNFTLLQSGEVICKIARWNGNKWFALEACDYFSGTLRAMTVFDDDPDDGVPPALYIGGDQYLYKWDGRNLTVVNNRQSLNGTIHSLAVYGDPNNPYNKPAIYAGGDFTAAGSTPVRFIAKWMDDLWEPVGDGFSAPVSSTAVFDDDGEGGQPPFLYVATDEFPSNGVPIARWDGSNWSTIGYFPCNCEVGVNSLAVFDMDGPGPQRSSLLVGSFGILARWDGDQWSVFPNEIMYWWGNDSNAFGALATHEPACGDGDAELLVGGRFSTFSSYGSKLLAKWSGRWSYVMAGIGSASPFTQYVPPIAVGTNREGRSILFSKSYNGFLQRWNSRKWEPLALSVTPPFDVSALQTPASSALGEILLGGRGNFGSGVAPGIAAWSEATGYELLGPPLASGSTINALVEVIDDPKGTLPGGVYVTGKLKRPGSSTFEIALRWDQTGWHSLGAPFNATGTAYKCILFDDDGDGPAPPTLIFGGNFVPTNGSRALSRIARWDGRHWIAMDKGFLGTVYQLVVADPDGDGPRIGALYAIGHLALPGQPLMETALHWSGQEWEPIKGFQQISYIGYIDRDGYGPQTPTLFLIGRRPGGNTSYPFLFWQKGEDWENSGAMFALSGPDRPCASVLFDDDGDPATPSATYISTTEFLYKGLRSNGIARFGPPLSVGLSPPVP